MLGIFTRGNLLNVNAAFELSKEHPSGKLIIALYTPGLLSFVPAGIALKLS